MFGDFRASNLPIARYFTAVATHRRLSAWTTISWYKMIFV